MRLNNLLKKQSFDAAYHNQLTTLVRSLNEKKDELLSKCSKLSVCAHDVTIDSVYNGLDQLITQSIQTRNDLMSAQTFVEPLTWSCYGPFDPELDRSAAESTQQSDENLLQSNTLPYFGFNP